MFKFIFRAIALFLILIILIIVLAIWKGGEGFRWIGGKIGSAGKAIERFGDVVDGLKEGGEKAGNTLKKIKGGIDFKEKDATTDNRKRHK